MQLVPNCKIQTPKPDELSSGFLFWQDFEDIYRIVNSNLNLIRGAIMNAKQRVIAAIEQREPDAVPVGFSSHFPKGFESGETAIDAHMRFFTETDADICKIMNDNRIPVMSHVRTASEWKDVRTFSLEEDFVQRQLELTKRLLEKMDPQKFSLATLHGVVAGCRHATSEGYTYGQTRELMCAHYRENKQVVKDAFRRMADALSVYGQKFVELGMDGVMYASLGAEKQFFTDEEYAELVAPLEKQVLQAIREVGGYVFMHICKENLGMQRYAGYADYADVFNWGVYETDFSLEEGRKLFEGKTIWGGLANHSGALIDGTMEDIDKEVDRVIGSFGRKGFILGADCTLPTGLDNARILRAVNAAHSK